MTNYDLPELANHLSVGTIKYHEHRIIESELVESESQNGLSKLVHKRKRGFQGRVTSGGAA